MNGELFGIGRSWLGFALLNVLVFVLTLTGHTTADQFMGFAEWTFGIVVVGKTADKIGTKIMEKK